MRRTSEVSEATGTVSTAIPAPEYQPLLDAILAAADICNRPGPPPSQDNESVAGFARVVLARWTMNAQAFVLLRNAKLFADAYGIARIGCELAIRTAWAWQGGAGADTFKTPAERVRALIQADTYGTRQWLDDMHRRYPSSPRGYDDSTTWGRALMAATKVSLPNREQMAGCSEFTKDIYAFAFRGESGSVHSAARVLAANAAGEPPIAERKMLFDVLAAAFVVLDSVANMLVGDDRARRAADRLNQVLRGWRRGPTTEAQNE